ncbi:MAG TPA: multiheme c-type cytochrome [Thermoanaerobaculia bacterium]
MKRVLAVVVVFLGSLTVAISQQPPATGNQPVATASATPGRYVGVGSCANSGCHGATQPIADSRILHNEFYTWLGNDRHVQAYNILFNERSARIAKNMRLKRRAYEEKVCLDCHTTNVPAALVDVKIDPEDGVQCEACHGPASGWRAEHTQEGWTHAQSVARGMIDLRAVPVRAQLCAGCHVGNANKEVDHELIASGHPVLAFELDNFSEQMPAHWKRDESDGVRAWATGQVVKFRESLDNLARHARGDEWPEFSDMSCTNCHHALRGGEARQARGWPDRAGLPAWSPQHWTALRVLIGKASPAARDELDPLVRELAVKVARMHDREGIAATALRARRAVDAVVPRVDAMRWNDAEVRALMTAIANDRFADVHAAQQAALALQSLSSAMTRRNPRLLRGATTRTIDALFEQVQDVDAYDPDKFSRALAEVKASL